MPPKGRGKGNGEGKSEAKAVSKKQVSKMSAPVPAIIRYPNPPNEDEEDEEELEEEEEEEVEDEEVEEADGEQNGEDDQTMEEVQAVQMLLSPITASSHSSHNPIPNPAEHRMSNEEEGQVAVQAPLTPGRTASSRSAASGSPLKKKIKGEADDDNGDEDEDDRDSSSSNGDDDNGSDDGDDPSDASSQFEHEDLGQCPGGHHFDRDCRCTCEHCPREDNDVDLDEQVRAAIERRIDGGYFDGREDEQVIYPPAPLPTHALDVELNDPERAVEDLDVIADGHPFFNQGVYRNLYTNVWNTPLNEVIVNDDDARAHAAVGAAVGQRSCTELVVDDPDPERLNQPLWDQNVNTWHRRCPNDWRGQIQTSGTAWPCNEPGCGDQENPPLPPPIQRHHHTGDYIDSDDEVEDLDLREDEFLEEEPPRPPRILPNNAFPKGNRWVCHKHYEENAKYWNTTDLLQAHLAPTCNVCRRTYHLANPLGLKSCTCKEFLRRWQCRRCLEKKIRLLQRDFRQRVTEHYTGELPISTLPADENEGPGLGTYHVTPGFLAIRALVTRHSPCYNQGTSQTCGRRRAANNHTVFHCRSCGGVVVLRRATRMSRAAQAEPFQELTFGRVAGRFGRARLL